MAKSNNVALETQTDPKLKTQSFTMSCRHCTTVESSSLWPTCRHSSLPRRSSTQRLQRWHQDLSNCRWECFYLDFFCKRNFLSLQKDDLERAGLPPWLVNPSPLSLSGETKTGGCSWPKIWELMLTFVGKHLNLIYIITCTLSAGGGCNRYLGNAQMEGS